jgi:hypothetical protein
MTFARLAATAAGAIALTASAPALAQNNQTYTYRCDLGGAPAVLVTQVTPVSDGAGGYNLQYAGRLDSQSAHYSFVGENAYADFTNLNASERFRVQFVVQGPQLMLIVNPQGPGPTQYMCQRTG